MKYDMTSAEPVAEPPRRAQVHVDESKARGFLLVGVFCADRLGPGPTDAADATRALRKGACQNMRREEASFLVLETDRTLVSDDKRWLFEELHKTDVRYDHRERHEEPLLWAADAIAWAWNRDQVWRAKVRPLVRHEIDA